MRKDRFTDEALRNAQALAELEFSESLDFARCQRADGSFYGIPEGKQCKKGAKAAPAEPKPRKLKTDFRKVVAEGAARRKIGDANIVSKQKEEARLRKAIARMYSRETNARRDGDTAAAKKFMKAHRELVKRLDEVKGAKGYDAAPKRSARSKSSKKSGSGTPEQRMQLRRLEERMDNAKTIKDQQRISTAIRELRKRMGEG